MFQNWAVSFARKQRGNVAVITGLAMIPILAGVSIAVEMTGISAERARLQAAVDAAALAGSNEMQIPTRSLGGIEATAKVFAQNVYSQTTNLTPVSFTAKADRMTGSVTVTGTGTRTSGLNILGKKGTRIEAKATAELLSSMPLCVLQTNYQPSKGRVRLLARRGINQVSGFTLQDQATIKAPGCMVQSNDTIIANNSSTIEAAQVAAVKSATGTISPKPNVGALPIADPFVRLNMNPKVKPTCTPSTTTIAAGETLNLPAGTHCEKFVVEGNGVLKLGSGEHYFYDNIILSQDSALEGRDVVLFFNSDNKFDFGGNARVELSAHTSGRFADFLIVTHINNYQSFTISSNNVRELLGTIYIPRAELIISSTGDVAQESAWSVIVARAITLSKSPVLFINSSYVGSGVPVPTGMGPGTNTPRLKN